MLFETWTKFVSCIYYVINPHSIYIEGSKEKWPVKGYIALSLTVYFLFSPNKIPNYTIYVIFSLCGKEVKGDQIYR